jgi:8-oxo-dGTP pyrophosphatase MutT (NUDIX family)
MSESPEKEKRITAHIIPYRIRGRSIYFFLQKRSDNAERHPGWFSIFGGGIEKGELPETAMLREAREELDFVPNDYFYLGDYGDDHSISHYFATEVADNFEAGVKIGEGEYGKFFSEEDVRNETKLTENNKRILDDLSKKIGLM